MIITYDNSYDNWWFNIIFIKISIEMSKNIL